MGHTLEPHHIAPSDFRLCIFNFQNGIQYHSFFQIPSSALNRDATSLMTLSLRANPIPVVPARAFLRLAALARLDLSDCGLEAVEGGAFDGLDNLRRIFLHGNRIVALGRAVTKLSRFHL